MPGPGCKYRSDAGCLEFGSDTFILNILQSLLFDAGDSPNRIPVAVKVLEGILSGSVLVAVIHHYVIVARCGNARR